MKIYALRDRLIDYFLVPFVAPGDNEVKAALAQRINTTTGGIEDALIQAPHHFELWELGEVHQDGHIEAKQSLVCDCSSLIRRGVRRDEDRIAAAHTSEGPTDEVSRHNGGDRGLPNTYPAALQATPPTGPRKAS